MGPLNSHKNMTTKIMTHHLSPIQNPKFCRIVWRLLARTMVEKISPWNQASLSLQCIGTLESWGEKNQVFHALGQKILAPVNFFHVFFLDAQLKFHMSQLGIASWIWSWWAIWTLCASVGDKSFERNSSSWSCNIWDTYFGIPWKAISRENH